MNLSICSRYMHFDKQELGLHKHNGSIINLRINIMSTCDKRIMKINTFIACTWHIDACNVYFHKWLKHKVNKHSDGKANTGGSVVNQRRIWIKKWEGVAKTIVKKCSIANIHAQCVSTPHSYTKLYCMHTMYSVYTHVVKSEQPHIQTW